MSSKNEDTSSQIREVVASFATRDTFRAAVAGLLAEGFKTADLSVLANHEALGAVGDFPNRAENLGVALFAGLADEYAFLYPMAISGIVLLSGGPVTAALAALVGAGIGVGAVKELLEKFTAGPHREDFAAALTAGALLLWVRVDDPTQEARTLSILKEQGGRDAHVNVRSA